MHCFICVLHLSLFPAGGCHRTKSFVIEESSTKSSASKIPCAHTRQLNENDEQMSFP